MKALRKFCIRYPLAFLSTYAVVLMTSVFAEQPAKLSDVIAPGNNLVTSGIPPVPVAIRDSALQYSDFRSAVFSSWLPSGHKMLIITRFGNTNQVHTVSRPGGDRKQLTFFTDDVFGASYQPKRAQFFIFSKDTNGDENYQIYSYTLQSAKVTLLTDGKSRNTDPVWSNDGTWIAYGSTRRNGRDVDLYKCKPGEPASTRLVAEMEGGGWIPVDWSPDDRLVLVRQEIAYSGESYLWVIDSATGERRNVTPTKGERRTFYGQAKFGKDGRGIYTTTDLESEFQGLVYIDLRSRRHHFLRTDTHWDVEEFDLSPDGKLLALVTNEEGFSVPRLMSVTTRRVLRKLTVPGGVISELQWHPNGRDLGFSFSSANSPTDAYSIDVQTGKLHRWTASEIGGLNPAGFAFPQLVHWSSFDGKTISGFLYQPAKCSSAKCPVIVNIHGGPEGQFRPVFLGRLNYYVNELGIAILFPNVRGSTGYGRTFLDLDNGVLREGSYKDIGAAFDWIASQPQLDSTRTMVTGVSYGGHMSLAVATYYNQKIVCTVDVAGPSSLLTVLEHTAAYRQDLRRVEYGDERDEHMREFLQHIAPVNNSENITKPLFVIQGKNDPKVPFSEAEQMVAAVRKRNTPVWYLLAEDEGHVFVKKPNVDFQFYATIMFVKCYLLRTP